MTCRLALLLAALAAVVATATAGGAAAPLPGSTRVAVCDAAGDYWPTMTLALDGARAWVACKEQMRVTAVSPATGKMLATVALDGPAIAVAAGYGSVWALDGNGTLYRIDRANGRIARRIDLAAGAPYNLWLGAGAVWIVDDASGEVLRVDPAKNRVTARIPVGDGPADMVFAGTTAWVVNHRDRGLVRLDTATNRARRLVTLSAEVPERMVRFANRLWITGRGTDLLEVDPATGREIATFDIGASGIDVVAAAGSLWVPARSAAVDPTGFPTMDALRKVSTTGKVTEVARPAGRLDVHGLAAGLGSVWLADNRSGTLYRLPA